MINSKSLMYISIGFYLGYISNYLYIKYVKKEIKKTKYDDLDKISDTNSYYSYNKNITSEKYLEELSNDSTKSELYSVPYDSDYE